MRESRPTTFPWPGTIIPRSATLRSKASRSSRVLADLPRGHVVTVIHVSEGWLYVEVDLANGIFAFPCFIRRHLCKRNTNLLENLRVGTVFVCAFSESLPFCARFDR